MDLEPIFKAIDYYNAKDPNKEEFQGKLYPKELLYGERMTKRLNEYASDASIPIKIAVRSQHIGRWEIPRISFPMDRVGYLKWRSQLALHHATLLEKILLDHKTGNEVIEKVKFLIQKKQLKSNPDTQLVEDVIFLVFVEYYLEPFSAKYDDAKVIEIIQKTLKKVSQKAIEASVFIKKSERVNLLINKALLE